MSTTTKTESTTPVMTVFNASSVMHLLWQKAAPKMSTQELEWLADGAGHEATQQTRSLSDILMGIGAMVAEDRRVGSFSEPDGVSDLLFNVSHQLSTINGLASIAEDAHYLLRMAHDKAMYSGEN